MFAKSKRGLSRSDWGIVGFVDELGQISFPASTALQTIPPSRLVPCHLPLHKGGFGVACSKTKTKVPKNIINDIILLSCYYSY